MQTDKATRLELREVVSPRKLDFVNFVIKEASVV
jgi:hypothetical protein